MLRTKVFMVRALLTPAVVLAAAPASGQDAVPIITPTMPNYVGFGLGVTPDYIGADDYYFGGLPLARYQFEDSFRYASLVGTFVDLNLIHHPIIRFGPTAQLRFGRSNVSNRGVRQLPSISKTVEAGVFGGLEFVAPDDPRKRLRLDLRFQQDLAGEHDGWLASSSVQGWYPIERLAEVGLALGTTYGSDDYMSTFFGVRARDSAQSGLAAFDADAGFRDVRLTLGVMVPVAEHWLVGAGVMFMRLVGDAADSPIVDDAGSPNQISGGLGVAYAW
ncbi:MAG: MipA/OmpV family protein [Geminicoccaceae bacterium]